MEVNCFQILLIDVTFYLCHMFNMIIKMKTRIYATMAVKGLKVKQNKLSTISMCRAASKLGVCNLLKSLVNKGWCECYAIVGPK